MVTRDALTVHCLIRNEENWIWFALQSALPFCKQLFLWDTGSSDRTLDVVRQIASSRMHFRQVGEVPADELVQLRNAMIAETTTDWFALVDGDEVWPPALWAEIGYCTCDEGARTVIVPFCYPFPRLGFFNASTDGACFIAGVRGFYASRVFRTADGVQFSGKLGEESISSADGTLLSGGHQPWMRVTETPVWHMTMLERSSHDRRTLWRSEKLQLGDPSQIAYTQVRQLANFPEVFFQERPTEVDNPFYHECAVLKDAMHLPHPGLNFV